MDGLLDDEVVQHLDAYVSKHRVVRIPFRGLLGHVLEADGIAGTVPEVESSLTGALEGLSKDDRCSLQRNESGKITSVFYMGHVARVVLKAHRDLEEHPENPFPREESLGIELPAGIVQPVDLRKDFVTFLDHAGEKPYAIQRIIFPNTLPSILTSGEVVTKHLPDEAVHKVRMYLRTSRNAAYMQQKLLPAFRSRERAVREMMNAILTQPKDAIKTVHDPDDFAYHFWTQISGSIVKEYQAKNDLQEHEIGQIQGAYLLGYYIAFHRGVQRREKERSTAFEVLGTRITERPYLKQMNEILSLKDDQGIELTKWLSREDIQGYVSERLKPPDETSLPPLIRIRAADRREYVIAKEQVVEVALERALVVGKALREEIMDSWKQMLNNDEETESMKDDSVFEREVLEKVKRADPALMGMLTYELLFLLSREVSLNVSASEEVNRVLDVGRKRLIPINEILYLDRRRLYDDVRLMLPFWKVVPILRGIVRFFKRLATGKGAGNKRKKTKSSAKSAPSTGKRVESSDSSAAPGGSQPTAAEFRERLEEVKKSFIRDGQDLRSTLEDLAERWNPLLDPTAKANLRTDVDSLVRDFLRRMRLLTRRYPPTPERIRELALQLAEKDAFDQIRARRHLVAYIELYMIHLMEQSTRRR